MENSICGKVCCCFECEEMESCKDICTEMSSNCQDAFTDETALAIMQKEAAEIIKSIANLALQKRQIEEQEKGMRVQLMAAMEKYGVKSFENKNVKFTYVAPGVENRLDSKALKADLPEIAAKYTKQNSKAGYVKITVKG